MALKYVGEHGAALDGIPARDLSDEEARQYGGEAALIKTGLYSKAESAKLKAESARSTRAAGSVAHEEGE